MSYYLFDSDQEPCCSYCRHGTALGRDEIACVKKGIMHSNGDCGSFRYEPTKRVPTVLMSPDFDRFTEEDFKL